MNTIILVHGLTDTPRRMAPMASYLTRRGRKVLCPVLSPSDGSVPIEQLAAILEAFIIANIPLNERIDLVGFSMGGLVCRYYLQQMSGASITDRFVSISSPNNGTRAAYLLPGAGIRQMRPGSLFLQTINNDVSKLRNITCTVLYTSWDLIIIPARSSILPFAQIIRFTIPAHPLMVYHWRVLRRLHQLLSK